MARREERAILIETAVVSVLALLVGYSFWQINYGQTARYLAVVGVALSVFQYIMTVHHLRVAGQRWTTVGAAVILALLLFSATQTGSVWFVVVGGVFSLHVVVARYFTRDGFLTWDWTSNRAKITCATGVAVAASLGMFIVQGMDLRTCFVGICFGSLFWVQSCPADRERRNLTWILTSCLFAICVVPAVVLGGRVHVALIIGLGLLLSGILAEVVAGRPDVAKAILRCTVWGTVAALLLSGAVMSHSECVWWPHFVMWILCFFWGVSLRASVDLGLHVCIPLEATCATFAAVTAAALTGQVALLGYAVFFAVTGRWAYAKRPRLG